MGYDGDCAWPLHARHCRPRALLVSVCQRLCHCVRSRSDIRTVHDSPSLRRSRSTLEHTLLNAPCVASVTTRWASDWNLDDDNHSIGSTPRPRAGTVARAPSVYFSLYFALVVRAATFLPRPTRMVRRCGRLRLGTLRWAAGPARRAGGVLTTQYHTVLHFHCYSADLHDTLGVAWLWLCGIGGSAVASEATPQHARTAPPGTGRANRWSTISAESSSLYLTLPAVPHRSDSARSRTQRTIEG